MSDKIAPVQGYTPGIPWDMHLEAYDAYSKKWAPQPALIDLEGRGCRGGFSTGELDEFIPGWRERLSERTTLKKRIEQLTAQRDAAYEALDAVLELAIERDKTAEPMAATLLALLQSKGVH